MAINFNAALGIHEQALQLRTQRASILARNLANADTPGFQARDIDFKTVLRRQVQKAEQAARPLAMRATQSEHQLHAYAEEEDPDLLYRIPMQPSIDGNTVDQNMEQAEFMRNAMDFEFSFLMLNKKFMGLKKALRGE